MGPGVGEVVLSGSAEEEPTCPTLLHVLTSPPPQAGRVSDSAWTVPGLWQLLKTKPALSLRKSHLVPQF